MFRNLLNLKKYKDILENRGIIPQSASIVLMNLSLSSIIFRSRSLVAEVWFCFSFSLAEITSALYPETL